MPESTVSPAESPAPPTPPSRSSRRARLIEIQAGKLASGHVPRSCRDLGRINPEAILRAAWLIQCRQAEEA